MKIIAAVITVLYCMIQYTYACTEFVLPTEDRTILVGRTMMFSYDFAYDVRTAPKRTLFQAYPFPSGSSCNGKKPPRWHSKSAIAFMTPTEDYMPHGLVDGQNADGLSVGVLYFDGYAKYPSASEIPVKKCGNAVPHLQLSEYILARFSNTQELRDAINNDDFPFVWTEVSKLPDPEKPGETMDYIFPLHWSVVDRSGNALVIEYTKEGRKIHENTLGVFTNQPTYDWHMTNLHSYVNLQSVGHPERKYENINGEGESIYGQVSSSSGGLGMPGDFTSASRFIRTAAMVQFGEKPKDAKGGANKAWQILNAIGVPLGSGGSPERWSVVKDLTNNILYFREQQFMSIRTVELNKASKTSVKALEVRQDFSKGLINVTDQMKDVEGKQEL